MHLTSFNFPCTVAPVAQTAISHHLPICAAIPQPIKCNVIAQQKEGVPTALALLCTELQQHKQEGLWCVLVYYTHCSHSQHLILSWRDEGGWC